MRYCLLSMEPGTIVAGKYRVERIIGRGGMGIVVEATHLHLETRVALKFLAAEMAADATAIARFRREAQASARLTNEHICRVSDFGVEGKIPYIVMELLKGTDLSRLSRKRLLDVATAALYMKQACAGLAEAHKAGIIHRDLKPGNLFLTRRADGSPLIKILDFGVAKTSIENEARLTATSNVVGSPGFMSPEQFRSSKTVDARTDIWAIGAILYKLISGRLPFQAASFAEYALAVTRDPLPPLPEAPPAFEAVIATCLSKDLATRYLDVHALSAALAPFAESAPPQAPLPEDSSPKVGDVKQVKQTILGMSAKAATSTPSAPVEPSLAASGSLPTVAGTAVGVQVPRYVPAGELPSGTPVGEYRIDGKIGEGGMGVVYSATHPLIGKRAAIKVIAANLEAVPVVVERFIQEARSVNQIGHPNIVDVFAFGQLADGRNYFVMEYLQGESLRARLSRSFMTVADAVQILDEIAAALEAAHEKQIVHRDLKPDNVFLASVRGGFINVKLLDFGIAKLTHGDGGIAKTHTGELMGTPAYLSPEQARGRGVDHRTDIYALGVMMFEMITGRIPFMAESSMDIVMMHVTEEPPRPSSIKPDIPPLIEQLILQMLDKDPDRRPSLVQVRNLFAELVASGQVQIEPGSGSTFRSDLTRRRGDTESRTPPSAPRAIAAKPSPPTVLGETSAERRRTGSPSEAPTGIAFTPGSPSETQAPLSGEPRKKSKRGLVIAIIALAALIPTVTIAIAMMKKGGKATEVDAAVTQVATPTDAALRPPADAAVVAADAAVAHVPAPADGSIAVAADAAIAQARTLAIRTNVPGARIEIDGAVVDSPGGVAKVPLTEGSHRIVISAAGRTTVDKTIEITGTSSDIDIRLERAKKITTGTGPESSAGSAATKAGSGSATYGKDGTIDPFAP